MLNTFLRHSIDHSRHTPPPLLTQTNRLHPHASTYSGRKLPPSIEPSGFRLPPACTSPNVAVQKKTTRTATGPAGSHQENTVTHNGEPPITGTGEPPQGNITDHCGTGTSPMTCSTYQRQHRTRGTNVTLSTRPIGSQGTSDSNVPEDYRATGHRASLSGTDVSQGNHWYQRKNGALHGATMTIQEGVSPDAVIPQHLHRCTAMMLSLGEVTLATGTWKERSDWNV